MHNFVTLFDSYFLPQGIALHLSMQRYIKKYVLWILCMDAEAYQVLAKLNLPNIRLLRIELLENSHLLAIKNSRTTAEYCWTLTPFTAKFVFEADKTVNLVTYVDADIWFMSDVNEIFEEFKLSNKDILVTSHNYSPEYDQSRISGKYCVQFLSFTRNGEPVRKWWEERCIEWCYAKAEGEKFGDQKYLESWPLLFPEYVHVLKGQHFALAPWNVTRFPYSDSIFYHFHGLRLGGNRRVHLGNFTLPKVVIKNIYRPYLDDLNLAIKILSDAEYVYKKQTKENVLLYYIKSVCSIFYKKIYSIFNSSIMRL